MRKRRVRQGGSLGHVILKVLRGISGFLGGPTSLKQAKERYIRNTKNGMGRRRKRRTKGGSLVGRLRLN